MVDEKLPFFAVLRGHPYRLHNKLNTEFLLAKTMSCIFEFTAQNVQITVLKNEL